MDTLGLRDDSAVALASANPPVFSGRLLGDLVSIAWLRFRATCRFVLEKR